MTVRVMLAGAVAIEVDGRTVGDGDLGRPARLALAYLVCERHRPVPRDELAEILWGEELPRSWGQLLRGIASKLRGLLGSAGLDPTSALTSAFGAYRLNLGTEVVVDVEAAAAGLDAGEAALAVDAELALELASAAGAVAARQFLPGASGAWVERRQAELRELRLRALDVVAGAEEARCRWPAAVAAAEEAIGLEPFRESAYLRLMAAHAGAGNRGEALRAYERCRRILAEEMGVNPSPTTEAAYLGLLGDEPVPAAPAPADTMPLPPALAAAPGAFFVGREPERARLASAVGRAAGGARQAVLVAGEPGIGKTALVADLARQAHLQGVRVLYGRCDEGLGVAYQPFAEALGHYAATCPITELADHVATHGGELSRLVPDLARRLPSLSPVPPTDPEADRYRLFEASAALLAAASVVAPVVVVVEDLHWATNATLLLLRHLLRDPNPAAVAIIGTYRHSEVDADHPLAATLADLRREPEGMTRIRLDGLDADGVAAFVRAAKGSAPGEGEVALAQALHAHTAGNPFFVGQLLAHIAETGAVYRRAGRWSFYADPEGLTVPEGVREVVARRLHRLSGAATSALTLAAVMGNEFDIDLLEAVSDGPGDGVLDAVEEAVGGRLVEEVGHGHYRFAHALVRDTIYAGLTTTRQGRLHRRIGEALEAMPSRDDSARLPALARHFAQAASTGTAVKAADAALAAARQAVDHAAWEDAAALLEQGLEALDALDAPDLERCCDLLLLQAETWTRFYDPPRAADAAMRAGEVARALGSPERLGWAAHWYFRAASERGLWSADASRKMVDEALAALGQASPGLRARLLAALASLQKPAREISTDTAEEAVTVARLSGDMGALGVALNAACGARRGSANGYEHLALAEELVSAAPPDGWDGWRNGYSQRAMARLSLGDRAGFEADAAACERFGAHRRFWYFRWIGALWQAGLALLDGRLGEVEGLAAHAASMAPAGEFTLGAEFLGRQRFRLCLELGDLTGALSLATGLVEGWPANTIHRAMVSFVRCELGDSNGRHDLEAFADEGLGPMASERWPVTLAYRAEVAVALGGAERARRLYKAFHPYVGQIVIGGMGESCMGAVDRYLGMLAAAAEDWDEAARHYEAALGLETALHSPPLVARTQSWYGRMLLIRGDAGDAERASGLLAASTSTAERLGMAGLAEQVRAAPAVP